MTLDEAIIILARFNQWRTGADERTIDETNIKPKAITEAIDTVCRWYEAPSPYAVELIERMLIRMEEQGSWPSICKQATAYLHNMEE